MRTAPLRLQLLHGNLQNSTVFYFITQPYTCYMTVVRQRLSNKTFSMIIKEEYIVYHPYRLCKKPANYLKHVQLCCYPDTTNTLTYFDNTFLNLYSKYSVAERLRSLISSYLHFTAVGSKPVAV